MPGVACDPALFERDQIGIAVFGVMCQAPFDKAQASVVSAAEGACEWLVGILRPLDLGSSLPEISVQFLEPLIVARSGRLFS